jgi:hypothetical protein
MYSKNLIPHHLRGSCPPNAQPTSNGLNVIKKSKHLIFINKANLLKQIIIVMKKGRTIFTLTD